MFWRTWLDENKRFAAEFKDTTGVWIYKGIRTTLSGSESVAIFKKKGEGRKVESLRLTELAALDMPKRVEDAALIAAARKALLRFQVIADCDFS